MTEPNSTTDIVFIDTNIWLYAFTNTQDEQKHRKAQSLIKAHPTIALSTQVINETLVNLLRKFQASETDVQNLVRTFFRKYIIVELDQLILLQASDLRISYHLSYWDSTIIASALAVGAKILFSEDMQDGIHINQQLTIVNPFT